MSLPTVTGYPDYSSTGQSKFIGAIWSGKLQQKFYANTVLTAISNTDFDGDIKEMGDMVYIRTLPDISVKNYVKGQKLDYERPESLAVDLLIDKGKYFAFTCDDVDKWQSEDDLLSKWSQDASEQIKVVVDAEVLGSIQSSADSKNRGAAAGLVSAGFNMGATGSPVQITKTNVVDYIVDCGTILDEQNIPDTDRWVVIPSWMAGMIKKSDLRDVSMTGGDTSIVVNGRLGMIDRFMVYLSNNVSSAPDSGETAYDILFGHRAALTFAAQMTKIETLRAERTFGYLVRGLVVYGYSVLKPASLGVLYAYR